MCARTLVILSCALSMAGCVDRRPTITQVQLWYGRPDMISDESGDLMRSYLPNHRPEEEWPAEAPRTFYYLNQNIAVTFVNGREVSRSKLNSEMRKQIDKLRS